MALREARVCAMMTKPTTGKRVIRGMLAMSIVMTGIQAFFGQFERNRAIATPGCPFRVLINHSCACNRVRKSDAGRTLGRWDAAVYYYVGKPAIFAFRSSLNRAIATRGELWELRTGYWEMRRACETGRDV